MAIDPERAGPRARRGLIGPFGGRQIAAGLLIVGVVVVVILGASAPLATLSGSTPVDPRPTAFSIGPAVEGLRAGDLAPELAVVRPDGTSFQLTDLTGKPVRLADLRGRAVWLNFWASWCPPCQAETPILRQLDLEYRDRGLSIVGISVQESNVADVAAYVAKYSLGYVLPTQFFIAPDGRISQVTLGPLEASAARQRIDAILPR